METKELKLEPIAVENIKRDDIIYIDDSPAADPYQVRDIGVPFILIENMNTHFCYCYRIVTPIYKRI